MPDYGRPKWHLKMQKLNKNQASEDVCKILDNFKKWFFNIVQTSALQVVV